MAVTKTDEMAEQLESMLEQDSTLKSVADGVKKCVNSDTVTMVIRYVDCNGEEICSKEYVSK